MALEITVDDFINFFGTVESIELSNLEDPSINGINEDRIQNAIDIAFQFVMSYDSLCIYSGKIAIRRALKRLVLDISGYFLD